MMEKPISPAINHKQYIWHFIKLLIFALSILLLSNVIEGTDLLGLTELLVAVISSVILVTIRLLYDKYLRGTRNPIE